MTFACPSTHILVGPNTTTCMGNGEWEPDPRLVECIGEQTMHISIVSYLCHRTIYTANCGPVPSSANGYVLPYTNTLEGASVMFMCQNVEIVTAVCTRAGKWEPNPVDICGGSCKLNQLIRG